MQRAYITENPHPPAERAKLAAAADGSTYSLAHGRWHPFFRMIQERRGYYDVFLISADGQVVYTVFKETDFATDLIRGQWRDTDLARIFARIRANPNGSAVAFSDFAPYAPSNGDPAGFIAAPVLADGRFLGAVVFQMPIDRINQVMQARAGMGETGEVYLVGIDRLMRTDSRFSQERTLLRQRVDTEAVRSAFNERAGTALMKDYRGEDVLSSYQTLTFEGARFAVIAEIDEGEVLAPVRATRNTLLVVGLVVLGFMALVGFLFARSMTRPLASLTAALNALAAGKLDVEIPGRERADEIGDIGRAVKRIEESAVEKAERERQMEEESRQRAAAERKRALDALADALEAEVGAVVKGVAAAATEL
ncbi:cache domain-containing protein, partial [Elioraea tepidiphila]|uniref:cache domain-containing protein n=1 Tax=Elioraea tepidiphila TaxID=457934 RepID=UPI002FDA73FC